MRHESATLTYRRAVTEQASSVGLVIALCDTLASDLQKAVAAMRRADSNSLDLGAIQDRANALKHALQVLGQLNALLDPENGGTCAQNLARFYEHLRRRILVAQFEKNPQVLDAEIPHILQVRTAWQQVDSRVAETGLEPGNTPDTARDHQPFSCSA